ncbi:MAG: J domain-containing protein [Nannocystaceae bacterium]|nr:J domain-containing protein [Nannocystaceae bacterium]
MSIGKRLLDLARSNVTDFRDAFSSDALRDLLNSDQSSDEPAAPEPVANEGPGKGGTTGTKAGRQARRFKDAAEEAWERAYENARTKAGVRGDPASDPLAQRKQWYRTLEVDSEADLRAVRKAYRKQLLQYHPDRHASDPEKYKAATEVTRRLTEAYNGLTRYLGG